MKIAVYAICKNELKFIKRWMESMSEADEIVVLDTGSDDGSPELLASLGAKVTVKNITPWRFDAARNLSLELVSSDTNLCVCTDLDELFEPGWRIKVEETASKYGADRIRYRYTWSFNDDGTEGYSFLYDKIHSRYGFRWTHPVHEVLERTDGKNYVTAEAPGVWLKHYPDKNKSRSQYLPLLELSVKEAPEDDRNTHYLGREYMFSGRYSEAVEILKRHLVLKSATWEDERCASMRYIAKCCVMLSDFPEAERWFLRAAAEAPHLREPFVDAADFYYSRSDYNAVIFMLDRALKIKERALSYISDPLAWGSFPEDLMSIALYNTGRQEEALSYARKAAALSPDDKRIAGNVALIKEKISKNQT